ncbi:MAG: hypothetical protein F4Y00_03360 [Bacteroidetes bacterium SB0662_bin_6]|nr:hypothetical protein [Bacteroidetes bacterium SB0668_bin_1]MYE03998.1 hypothetical protein [Bacteroidetes bacterium SB0662_bin_6]
MDSRTENQGEIQMKIHKNARLTPKGREILVCRIVNEGLRVEEAARIRPESTGVSD